MEVKKLFIVRDIAFFLNVCPYNVFPTLWTLYDGWKDVVCVRVCISTYSLTMSVTVVIKNGIIFFLALNIRKR